MKHSKVTTFSLLLSLCAITALSSGCVVVPRGGYHEGYYDHAHARYWHNHAWVRCDRDDRHCR